MMKARYSIAQLLTLLVLCSYLAGCFGRWGEDLTTGASHGLLKQDSELTAMLSHITGTAVASARDSAITPKFSHDLALMIDSLVAHAGSGATKQAVALRDSILSQYVSQYVLQLKDGLIGDKTRGQLAALRSELLGAETNVLISTLRDNLLGTRTREQLAALRDELIGPSTTMMVDTLISHAINQAATDYRTKLQPIVHDEESFVKRNASTLAWTGGFVIAFLLVVGAWAFRKYRNCSKMLNVITYQIHDMDDQEEYDELTSRISKKSKEAGVEADLRSLLKKRGLLEDHAAPTPTVQIA